MKTSSKFIPLLIHQQHQVKNRCRMGSLVLIKKSSNFLNKIYFNKSAWRFLLKTTTETPNYCIYRKNIVTIHVIFWSGFYLIFNFDGDEFVRQQSGFGESYEVSLLHTNLKQIINCEDPFRSFIEKFSKKIINKYKEDDFSNAEAITKLSAYSMNIINKT